MSRSNKVCDDVILATAGYDRTIKFWNASSGVCKATVQHGDSQVNALEISHDRRLLAAAGHQRIRMYNLELENPVLHINFEGVNKNFTAIGFQDQGNWMYTGGEDCSAKVWDLRAKTILCQKIFQVNAPVNCVCLHPNQVELIVGDQSGIIHIWDLVSSRNEQLIPEPDSSILHISIDPDGNYMAAVNNKGNCYVWALARGVKSESTELKPKMKLLAHNKYALKCKFSPDSTLLVTTSADTTAKVWKTSDFSLVRELSNPNQRWVWDLAFSADSRYVTTASSDNVARLWDLETGKVEREYKGHEKALTCLVLNDVII